MAVPVKVKCLCPPRPDGLPRHEADYVNLRDRLDFRQAVAVRVDIRETVKAGGSEGELEGMLAESYVLHGVESWSLVDEKNKPLPLTRENLRNVLLADYDTGQEVANEADNLYTEAVVLPLLQRASTSLQGSPMPDSTSPTNGTPTRKPRSRSSTSTTPTGDTGTTSPRPAGVFKPLPNSVSAA